ncbi:hypothetical protein KFK09_000645 [Dendrobium nobile]|uniref:Uncharacterized protein n=1 Tax=Dendrobium nobile TaxID=94219 RepID=A0A8T3CFC8_DENNO|nr:hypothetical protein KFK09_000645 [Dendrobium nobile]
MATCSVGVDLNLQEFVYVYIWMLSYTIVSGSKVLLVDFFKKYNMKKISSLCFSWRIGHSIHNCAYISNPKKGLLSNSEEGLKVGIPHHHGGSSPMTNKAKVTNENLKNSNSENYGPCIHVNYGRKKFNHFRGAHSSYNHKNFGKSDKVYAVKNKVLSDEVIKEKHIEVGELKNSEDALNSDLIVNDRSVIPDGIEVLLSNGARN